MSNVSLVDVRFVDGEPHEVALKAGEQLEAALLLSQEALEGLSWSARGAWLTQEHHRTGSMPTGDQFGETPLNRKLDQVFELLKEASRHVRTIKTAAAYDPRSV